MFYAQSLDKRKEPLNPLKLSGFSVSQNVDGRLTVSFTSLKSDNNPGHELLENKGIVHVEGYDYRVEQYSDTAYSKSITAISIFYDHNKTQIEGVFKGSHTLLNHLDFALKGTGWTCDIDITIASKVNYIEDLGDDNVIAILEKIKQYHGVEYLILPDKHLYVAKEIGPENDFVYRYKHNVSDVVIKKDTTNLATVIKGYGANGLAVEYISPNVNTFGRLEANPIRDERFIDAKNLLDHLATQIQDEPSLVIESRVPYLTERSIGERVWLNYEPLGINIKVRIVEQTKILVGGKLVTSSVVFGNTIYKTSIDTAVEQQIRIKETVKKLYLAREEYRKRFEDEREETNQLIQIAANGKNAIYRSVEEPVGELKDGDLWYKPLGNGETQLYQYGNNVWELVLDTSNLAAIEQAVEEAKEDAQSAIDAVATAEQNASDALARADSALMNAQDSFNKAQEALAVQIGGRNLLRDSRMMYFLAQNANVVSINIDTGKQHKLNSNGNGAYFGIQNGVNSRKSTFTTNKPYTVSFDIRGNVSTMDYIYLMREDGANQAFPAMATSLSETEFKRVSVTMISPWTTERGFVLVATKDVGLGKWFEIKNLQIEQATKPSDFSIAPEEVIGAITDLVVSSDAITARVNTAEGNVNALQLSTSGLATRVSDTEGSISTLTQTISGLQTAVMQKVDTTTYNSYVTQTAQAINSKLSSVDAANTYATQSSLTQTSNSFQSTITEIRTDVDKKVTSSEVANLILADKRILDTRDDNQAPNWYFQNYPGQTVREFKLTATMGLTTAQTGGMYGLLTTEINWKNPSGGKIKQTFKGDNGIEYKREGTGITPTSTTTGGTWSPWVAQVTQSQITQLQDNINLRVTKNDIVNQINISSEGILIDGRKIRITGQTVIDDAAISSAKIASLDAGKITTGVLNAANVTIINLNASNITTGVLNVARLGGGEISGNTIKTSNSSNYLHMQNQVLKFFNSSLEKMSIGFTDENGVMNAEPYIVMGAGNSYGHDKVFINKYTNNFRLSYLQLNGYEAGLKFVYNTGNASLLTRDNLYLGGTRVTLENNTLAAGISEMYVDASGRFYLRDNKALNGSAAYRDLYAGTIYSNGTAVTSKRESKKNIEEKTLAFSGKTVLEEIVSTKVHDYHLKADLDTELKRIGLIVDEAPSDIIDLRGEGIDLYAMASFTWKGIQELHDEVQRLRNQVANLEQRIA